MFYNYWIYFVIYYVSNIVYQITKNKTETLVNIVPQVPWCIFHQMASLYLFGNFVWIKGGNWYTLLNINLVGKYVSKTSQHQKPRHQSSHQQTSKKDKPHSIRVAVEVTGSVKDVLYM